jgi:hypothetical protein
MAWHRFGVEGKTPQTKTRLPSMRQEIGTALAGLAAGVLVSAAMAAGRRARLLDKTLAEHAEDWLDRAADTRRRFGTAGTTAAEQVNHLAASAAFGAAYGVLRRRLPEVPPAALGALYGGALYAINIAAIAPMIGLTRGEAQETGRVVVQRLAMHLFFGTALAAFAEFAQEAHDERSFR